MLTGLNQFRSDRYPENPEKLKKPLNTQKKTFPKIPQKKYQQNHYFYDLAQKRQIAYPNKKNQPQKKFLGAQKKNRRYYANLLQKNCRFSLEERVIFERLWKGALCQTFGEVPVKQGRKNCCCHCQCDSSSADTFQFVPQKTMKSVIR